VSSEQHSLSDDDERRFALLGVLLQALHFLFGVTAIVGMYLTLGRLPSIKSEDYHDRPVVRSLVAINYCCDVGELSHHQ